MTEESIHLKQLPLHSEHERAGAHFGAFGEWLVPIYFTSVMDEHLSVRTGVGVFDISHMGEFYVCGRPAKRQVNHWITNDLDKLVPAAALYSPACRPDGGIVDDIVAYEISPEEYLLVVNAANIRKDFSWFQDHITTSASLENRSEEIALFAVQGPLSPRLIQALFRIDLTSISYYHFLKLKSDFGEIILSQTGYTGEVGFEIFLSAPRAQAFWARLFDVGTPLGLKPIGFGARDTLRLEARLPLYGHDLTEETTPLEAGLSWTVGWEKAEFIGRDALLRERAQGLKRKLIGFELQDRGIVREGCAVKVDHQKVGAVTSGTFSPTLKKSIGLAYVDVQHAAIGRPIEIEIRGKISKAVIVKTPFYKRSETGR